MSNQCHIDKTNKQLINDLQEYFLKQEPATIARNLAAMMIDINRISNIDALGPNEKNCLFARLEANQKELIRFAKEGPRNEPFTYCNIESSDER